MRYEHPTFDERNAGDSGRDRTSQSRLKNAKDEVTMARRDLQHTDHLSIMFDTACFRVVGSGAFTVSRSDAFDQAFPTQ
jgi:hypothetical protein